MRLHFLGFFLPTVSYQVSPAGFSRTFPAFALRSADVCGSCRFLRSVCIRFWSGPLFRFWTRALTLSLNSFFTGADTGYTRSVHRLRTVSRSLVAFAFSRSSRVRAAFLPLDLWTFHGFCTKKLLKR